MTDIIVDGAKGRLRCGEIDIACTIGRGGTCAAIDKREGDGCTPIGRWPIRAALLRPDRFDPRLVKLPWRWVRATDGWSDDPTDPAYNRAVRLPRPFSAETLRRTDSAYDVIVILGHNDAPPGPGMGSAIFLHLSEGRPTAGCVAIDRSDMICLLPMLEPGDMLDIR